MCVAPRWKMLMVHFARIFLIDRKDVTVVQITSMTKVLLQVFALVG